MDTGFFVAREHMQETPHVARTLTLIPIRTAQDLLNLEYEKALVLARRKPVPVLSTASPTVVLVDGPYDGQDIRVTQSELSAGSFMRNGQRYHRAGAGSPLGVGIMLPTFKWESGPLSVHARSVRARDAWEALKFPDRIDALECGLAV